MSDELRAAAERLLDPECGIGEGTGTNYVAGGYAADDAVALAKAYLAEHPADDAEPVTLEWTRSLGLDCRRIYDGPDWIPNIRGLDGNWVILPRGATRGQARRLLAALGIDCVNDHSCTKEQHDER
jgi:hypothetical protein